MKPLVRLSFSVAAFVTPVAFACFEPVLAGIHFKGGAVDFGQPPQRIARSYYSEDWETNWRNGTYYALGNWTETEPREKWQHTAYLNGYRAEQRGDFKAALATYRNMARRAQIDANFYAKRRALLGLPPATQGLTALLRATHPERPKNTSLPRKIAPVLVPWRQYELAFTASHYLAFARKYPHHAQSDAALIMAARALADSSDRNKLGLADQTARYLLTNYPTSRFRWDAVGILGRVRFKRGNWESALTQYQRQRETAKTGLQIVRATNSLVLTRLKMGDRAGAIVAWLGGYRRTGPDFDVVAAHQIQRKLDVLSPKEARRLWRALRSDETLLSNYLDFRWQFTKPTSELVRMGESALRNLPASTARGHGYAVLAAIAYPESRHAERLANRALSAPEANDRAIGEFVLGGLARRTQRNRTAERHFKQVIQLTKAPYLVNGAKENLVILAERQQNLTRALDLYTELGYNWDICYMVDARMSPGQLASYIARRPHHPQRDVFQLTLAYRYMRRSQWDAAEAALRAMTAARVRKLAIQDADNYFDRDKTSPDPFKTLHSLRYLDRQVRATRGDARAKALVAMADYYYNHRSLLLYSAPLWQGGRAFMIGYSWNASAATPEDDRALERHHREHECLSQALIRYREVVRKYPWSSVFHLAAYRAACAAERLSNMNTYWRWREHRLDLHGEAVKDMRLAARAKDPALAKRAQKYAHVYAKERHELREAFAAEKSPSRRFNE